MALAPFFFFFFFSGLLFLAWFTADVHSVKVLPDVLKGSSIVLSPDDAEKQIISITWKHGPDLAAEWFGWNQTFYNIFKDTCSLNTETGELTINDVRPEHNGVYTPEINGKTRSALKLQVLSPVPKPTITMNCNPGETKCSLSCWFDRTDDLGDVEVFWILDDSHEKGGRKLQITKDTKEETFICSLKNPFSSQNSAKLQNPFLPRGIGVPVWIPVVGTLVSLASIGTLVGLIILRKRRDRVKKILEKIRATMLEEGETPASESVKEHDRILKEIYDTMSAAELNKIAEEIRAAGSSTDDKQILLNVDQITLKILRDGHKRKLSEDGIWMLLNARYLILSILQRGPEGKKSLDKVKEIIEEFYEGRNELWLYKDVKPKLWDVDRRISRILEKRNDFCLSKDEEQKLRMAHLRVERILREKNKTKLSEDLILRMVDRMILRILLKKEELKLSKDEERTLWYVDDMISRIVNRKEKGASEDVEATLQKADDMISRIISGRKEKGASEDEKKKLKKVDDMISRIIKERTKKGASEDDKEKLQDVDRMILVILREVKEIKLSKDEEHTLWKAYQMIFRIFSKREEEKASEAGSDLTSRPRDPAEEPLNSSSSRFEVEDPV